MSGQSERGLLERTTTTTPPSGPERFRPAPAPAQRAPLGVRLLSALGLLALVVGVPALLFWLSGPPPIPTRLPTREDITGQIGIEQVVTILVAIVWLAWLQFVACVIVEAFAAVRDGGIPKALPFSGPSQRLARVLVGALLLSGVVAGQVSAVVSAVSAENLRATSSISQSVATSSAVAPTTEAPTTAPAATQLPSTAVGAHPDGPKVYTVAPPVGRHHDSLWDIAERHLGDGRRYNEIFALNEGRAQPDGRALHLARLIQPGWQLVMPEDAIGVERMHLESAPVPSSAVSESAATRAVPGTERAEAGTAGDLAQGTGSGVGVSTAAASTAAARTSAVSDASSVDQGGTGGILDVSSPAAPVNPLVAAFAMSGTFAACLLAAVLRHRRRSGGGGQAGDDALDVEVGLRAGADPRRLAFVDGALRALATDCSATGLPVPQIYAARADDETFTVLLSPSRADAPDRWSVHDDGARWEMQRSMLGRGAATGPAAYPALVSLGRDRQGRDVFVDLEAAGGPIQVSGDGVVAGQVITALAVQLATVPWTDGVTVSAFGLPNRVRAIAADRIRVIDNPQDVVRRFGERSGVQGQDVLTGRVVRPVDVLPEYLLAATPLEADVAEALASVTSGGRHPFGFVGAGQVPGAAWVAHVDEAGTLTLPLLDIEVSAHRVVPRTLDALAELFMAASQPQAGPPAGAAAAPGAPAVALAPPPAVVQDDALLRTAAASVSLLGPLTLSAPGRIDPSQIPLAEEIVAYLAVNPGGVHSGVLAAAIWPRGVGQAVASATVDRVRDWLGTDADGSYRLMLDPSGRLRLSDAVGVDWFAFCTLTQRAGAARSPQEESELLRRALRLVRGQMLEASAPGRFSWLARTTLTRTVEQSVVSVAHRLVVLAEREPDPEGAAVAAALGLRLAPVSQLLWRDLIAAQHAGHGAEAMKGAVAEMARVLDGADVPMEGETEALIAHLSGPGSAAQA